MNRVVRIDPDLLDFALRQTPEDRVRQALCAWRIYHELHDPFAKPKVRGFRTLKEFRAAEAVLESCDAMALRVETRPVCSMGNIVPRPPHMIGTAITGKPLSTCPPPRVIEGPKRTRRSTTRKTGGRGAFGSSSTADGSLSDRSPGRIRCDSLGNDLQRAQVIRSIFHEATIVGRSVTIPCAKWPLDYPRMLLTTFPTCVCNNSNHDRGKY